MFKGQEDGSVTKDLNSDTSVHMKAQHGSP